MNKKISLLFVILGLLMIGLTSAYMTVTQTSPDNTSTTDRTPDFVYTAVSDNATTIDCNLTISGSTQPLNVEVVNNTACLLYTSPSPRDRS